MEFSQVITARRSIRKFKTQPVPAEKLGRIKEALRSAPTGNNRQPFQFLFVTEESLRRELVAKGCHQPGFADAPVIVVPFCEKGYSFDTAIAVDHLILAATDNGLGSCWVGYIECEEIKKLLSIPEDKEVPVIIPIGYADESPEARPRKPLEELVLENTCR